MENIFTVAKPFLTFGSFIGVFPMSFEGPARKGFLKCHWKDLIMTSICLSLLVVSLYVSMCMGHVFESFIDSKISSQGWNVIMNLTNSVGLCVFFYQLWKRKNIVRFLNLILNFDMQVRMKHFLSFQSLDLSGTGLPPSSESQKTEEDCILGRCSECCRYAFDYHVINGL
jgi:hypothetical protein